MSFTIVTGANATYWPLLADLINSIRSQPEGRAATISVLDLGLKDEHREILGRHVQNVVEPGWDIDFPDRDAVEPWFKAMVSRPFLPEHFPGYDFYLWIDCDAWVQDWTVLSHFLRTARTGHLAIVPEVDRSFVSSWRLKMEAVEDLSRRVYAKGWGEAVAEELGPLPALNTGVFALAAGAPHWRHWRESLAEALANSSDFMIEQSALNHAVYSRRLPTLFLPLYCNWICHLSLPAVSRSERKLVEAQPPFNTLGVVHLTHKTKNGTFDLLSVDGPRVNASLRFGRLAKALGS